MTKRAKIISLLVCAVLLVVSTLGIMLISGAETNATAEIGLKNVIYNEKMCFAVEITNVQNLEDNKTVGLIYWNEEVDVPVSELTVDNATCADFEQKTQQTGESTTVNYYVTNGIPADSVFDEVRFAACVKDNATGAISIISDIYSYSVAQYAGERIIADNVSKEQIILYQKIFDYGLAAMELLEDGDYAQSLALIKTEGGGTVGKHDYATMGGALGKQVTINAPTTNEAGEPFHGWEYNGYIVSKNTSFTVDLGRSGIYTYTAIYGTTSIPDAGEGDETSPVAPTLYTAEVMSAKGGADGIVVLIHDDGTPATVAIMDTLYEKYGLVGDMALTQNNAEKYTSTWQEYLDTGRWKVVSHSKTHTWWGQFTNDGGNSSYCDTETEVASHYDENGVSLGDNTSKLFDEVVGSQQVMRNLFPGQRVLTFAYPGFSTEKKWVAENKPAKIFEEIYSQVSRDLIEEKYISGRAAGLGFPMSIEDPLGAWATKNYDVYGTEDLWTYFPSYSIGKDITPATGAVDDAASVGGIAVIFCHKVVDEYTTGTNETLTSNWELLCQKIAGYKNEGKIWSANYEDAILYLREATTSSLTATGDINGMTVTLTDSMDDTIYNLPLTVRINAPAEWEAVKVVQGDSISYAYPKYENGVYTVDVEIVPDGGEAQIIPTTAKQIEVETTYDLKAEAYFDFNEGLEEASLKDPVDGVLAAVTEEGRTLLRMNKTTEKNGRKLILPLGDTVTDADTIEVSFSIRIDEDNDYETLFRCFLNSSSIYKSPIDARIFSGANGFSLGWANVKNADKSLAYGQWHNVKLVVKVVNDESRSVNATWYVDDVMYSTTDVAYIENDNTVDNTVNGFYMFDQSSAYFDMYLDSVYMRAYNGPDKKEPTEAEEVPELDSTTEWTFDENISDITVTKPTYGSIEKATIDSKNVITLNKSEGGGCQYKFPLATTVQPEVLKLSFDMYFHHTAADDISYSGNNAALRIYQYGTAYKNSPYSGSIHSYNNGTAGDITDDYFTIGDASTASAPGKEYSKANTALGGHLNFNEWYNIELLIHIGDGTVADFYAVWYVNGEFYGYSTNYYNEDGITPVPTAMTNHEANSIYIYALSASKFKGSFDNVTVDAYNDALKVEPDVVKTWDFEDAENPDVSIDTNDKTNNSYSVDQKYLEISKTSKSVNAKYTFGLDEAVDAEKIIVEFDILINQTGTSYSDTGTFVSYLFLNTSYTSSPYGARIYTFSDGFTFGDTNAASNETITNKNLGEHISYGEWHTVRLEIVTGGTDEFSATWYVDDVLYGTSTNHWGLDSTYYTKANSLYVWVQGSTTLSACIDDLTITVYKIEG